MSVELFRAQAELFKLLTHPLRIQILYLLATGEKTVTELMKLTNASQTIVSQHLAKLRAQKVVKTRKVGTTVYYSLKIPDIITVCKVLQTIIKEMAKENQQIADFLMQVTS